MSDLSGRLSGGQAISGSLSGGSTLRGGLSMGGVSPAVLLDKADVITDTTSGSIVSIPDGMASPVLGLDVEIEPIQDLHGYENPWPAGGGKNKLPMMLSNIKEINTVGSWSENTYVLYGVSYTCNIDDGDNIQSITVNGTASAYSLMRLYNSITFTNEMRMLGSPQSSYNGFKLQAEANVNYQDIGNGVTIPADLAFTRIVIVVPSGVSVSNQVFYPRVVDNALTDKSFSPYSNICPISGRSEVNVYLEESYDPQATPKATIQLGQTVYGGTVDVTEGKLTITHKTTIADGVNVKVAGVYADSTAYTDNIPDIYNDSSYAHQRDVMVLCDKLKASAYINIGSTVYGVSQNGGRRFIFNIPDTTTVAQYNAWLQANTPTVYYLLADPIEVTLTPQELDILFVDNNIWADSGDVSVDYRCDTKKYILKKIAEALNA